MDISIHHMLALFGCIIIGLANYQLTEALQCYVCDNCVDGTELEAIQICGELPFEPTTPSVSSSSSSAAQSTTRLPTTIEPSPFETVSSTRRSSSSRSTTSRASTRRPTTTTTRRPTTKQDSDSDENYSDYEDSDENDRKRRLAVKNSPPKQFEPVCFMVKYRVNNTNITSLGCTAMDKNTYLTCKSLNRTGATMEDCQLCGKNGCNKRFFSENYTDDVWEYPWLNGSNQMKLKIVNFLLMILAMKLIN